ncbi:MAG: hypothetical protein GX647_05670 [Clostridiales bacterium]|jgi:hypothetical protein|nr:hypothetical protein [Clostridiales bacterium]
MKRLFSVLVAAALLMSFALAEGDPFFATPEEAIVAFADCVGNLDFSGALDCMDAQVKAENYDMALNVARLGAIVPATLTLPSQYGAYVSLNAELFRNGHARNLYFAITSLLIGPEFQTGQVIQVDREKSEVAISPTETVALDELVARYDPEGLRGLAVREIYRYDKFRQNEKHQSNIQRQGLDYGFDAVEDYLVLYDLQGDTCAGTMMVAHYEQGWKITSLNSAVMGASPFTPIARVPDGAAAAKGLGLDPSEFTKVR